MEKGFSGVFDRGINNRLIKWVVKKLYFEMIT